MCLVQTKVAKSYTRMTLYTYVSLYTINNIGSSYAVPATVYTRRESGNGEEIYAHLGNA